MTKTLNDIEVKTKAYADARAQLADRVSALNIAIEALKRGEMKGIKQALARAAERHAELKAALEEAPALFAKPRTHVFYGVRVGYQKGKGKVTFEDGDKVVALIERHLPDEADVLIITTKRPNKEALATLPAAEVKRIGCAVTDTADVVVIRPTDSEVDKIVDALLKDATEETEA